MVDCIAPPQARITVAPAGHHVAVTLSTLRPAICTLSPSQATALARDLLVVARAEESSERSEDCLSAKTLCDLVTLRGMTLHLWRDGLEAGRVTLSARAALILLADLAQAIRGRV